MTFWASRRGYATGSALAGLITILLGVQLLGLALFDPDERLSGVSKEAAVLLPSAIAGGWFGGWLCHRWLVHHQPLTPGLAWGLAAATSGSSLIIGAVLGAFGIAIVVTAQGLIASSGVTSQGGFASTFIISLIFGVLAAVIVFGLPYFAVVVAWTLWWRRAHDRQRKAATPQ